MFVCRVLVGSYTRGQSNYRLPPSRDGGLILHDSCVNDCRDPSIFVVFDKQQVYPEFLITYTKRVYHPIVIDSSSDSDDLFSPQTVTVSSLTSTLSGQKAPSSGSAVTVQHTSSFSSALAVTASSPSSVSTPTSFVTKPSLNTPSFKSSDLNPDQALSSATTSAVTSLFQSSASTSSKQPSDPLQTVQTSQRVSYSDPKSTSSQSLYSSSDAFSVRSATHTSANTRRVSPPHLTTTTPSYTRPVTRPRSQDNLYYVPRSTWTPTHQPKKKEECILL